MPQYPNSVRCTLVRQDLRPGRRVPGDRRGARGQCAAGPGSGVHHLDPADSGWRAACLPQALKPAVTVEVQAFELTGGVLVRAADADITHALTLAEHVVSGGRDERRNLASASLLGDFGHGGMPPLKVDEAIEATTRWTTPSTARTVGLLARVRSKG